MMLMMKMWVQFETRGLVKALGNRVVIFNIIMGTVMVAIAIYVSYNTSRGLVSLRLRLDENNLTGIGTGSERLLAHSLALGFSASYIGIFICL